MQAPRCKQPTHLDFCPQVAQLFLGLAFLGNELPCTTTWREGVSQQHAATTTHMGMYLHGYKLACELTAPLVHSAKRADAYIATHGQR